MTTDLLRRIRRPRLLVALLALAAPALAQQAGATPDPTLTRAGQLLSARDWDAAVEVLEGWVLEHDSGNGWFLLGRALEGRGDPEAALDAYLAATELEDGFAPRAHFRAACLCASQGDVEDALAHVELAVEGGITANGIWMSAPALAGLREDERFLALVPPAKEPSKCFVEEPRILHTLVGEAPGDVFGWIGRNVGDADGDGRADLLISAPWNAEGGQAAGKIYVYSGATGELLFERAGSAGETLGIGIESAGDVDGDGRADALAGASGSNGAAGSAYVYSGRDGSTLLTLRAGEANDEFGRKVSGGVDLDGDGHSDLLIGAPGGGASGTAPGAAYVYSGKDGALLARIDGEEAGDRFGAGNAVWAGAGRKLLCVGAANGGDGDRGRAYVYRWEEGEARLAFTIDNDPTGANLGGMFVAFVGDMTGDGVSEVYASDWMNGALGSQTGRVYLHDGESGERLFALTGERAGIGFGTCTADIGDVTGDGIADLLIGAWQAPDAAPSGGKCWLYKGAARAEDLEVLATYTCNEPGETLGFDTTGVGDLDGDGGVDFLVTGGYSAVMGQRSGRCFVIAGPVPAED